VPLGLAGGAVWCPRPAPAPVNSIEYRCVRPTHRAAPYLPLERSSVESITARQLEAGLVLMSFHFLAHDGPVPHEVTVDIVNIVDEVVLPLLRAAFPSV
jgi:hypothetical protein